MKCQKILSIGALGATVDDEKPSQMCQRQAVWRIERPGVRPRIRCDEHAQEFRGLFDDVTFTPIGSAAP